MDLDHRRVSRKDRDREIETEEERETIADSEWLMTGLISEDGAVAPLSGEKFNYCSQDYYVRVK